VTDHPRRPQPCPGPHPTRPVPTARRALAIPGRALTIAGGLLLSLAVAAAVAPAASATLPPPEPPVGPPPPPPTVTAPGLPLWAVLVIVGGTIALSAATTLIILALHPTHAGRRPRSPARATIPGAMRRPAPPASPATRQPAGTATPPKDCGP
jgi:hypothetical protein